MIRDELLAAGARAWHVDSWKIDGDSVAAIIDAVEPLIRADEREYIVGRYWHQREADLLADLRAKVEALKDQYAPFASYEEAVDDVLALFDGGSDEPG